METEGEMICLNTDSMVEQKCALKDYFCDQNVVFVTEQRKTAKDRIYYWFKWRILEKGEGLNVSGTTSEN